MNLKGMRDKPEHNLKPWETDWHAYGPIPHSVFSLLAEHPDADGLAKTPGLLTVEGKTLRPVACRSANGFLDFRDIFHYREGLPIAYIFTEIVVQRKKWLPISFSADWTSRWWVNGRLVYDTSSGNGAPTEDIFGNQFYLPLARGKNVIQIKVGGGFLGWNIRLFTAPRAGQPEPAYRLSFPRVLNRPTRDYARTGLRIENRNPNAAPGPERWKLEAVARASGVESRWIQVVDSRDDHQFLGSPFFRTRHLTPSPGANAASEKRLKKWIGAIHAAGMPVISWYPMCYSTEAILAHPDWMSRPMPGQKKERFIQGCINSPYGEALIRFAVETIGRVGLDGFWFDGAAYGGLGHNSSDCRVGCACRHCRRKFKEQTGRNFPRRMDWSDPDFQRWLKWRFRSFAEFWGRLAGRIRRAHPHARMAITHWIANRRSGCPLNPTRLDIVGATEGHPFIFDSGFVTRVMRAYGYAETETWMLLRAQHHNVNIQASACLHHALACMTAGGMPSFGTDDNADRNARCYEELAAIINPRRPWVGGPAVPYAALHVSEQAATMVFLRWDLHDGVRVKYRESLLGWNNLLAETQCLTDVIFDDHLTPAGLSRYPVLILPLSAALSATQIAAIEDYVRGGGVLVAGPWLGSFDEWGERAAAASGRMRVLLGRKVAPPDPQAFQATQGGVTVRKLGEGWVIRLAGNPGQQFHQFRSRRLALEMAGMIKKLAPSPILMADNPDVHVGLFQRPGELVLHVQNGVGYSSYMRRFPNPVTVPPVRRRDVRIEITGFPVRAVDMAVGEAGSRPRVQLKHCGAVITIPRMCWGSVYRLEI